VNTDETGRHLDRRIYRAVGLDQSVWGARNCLTQRTVVNAGDPSVCKKLRDCRVNGNRRPPHINRRSVLNKFPIEKGGGKSSKEKVTEGEVGEESIRTQEKENRKKTAGLFDSIGRLMEKVLDERGNRGRVDDLRLGKGDIKGIVSPI